LMGVEISLLNTSKAFEGYRSKRIHRISVNIHIINI